MTNGFIKSGKGAKKVAHRDAKTGEFTTKKAKRKGGRVYRDVATDEFAAGDTLKGKPFNSKKKSSKKKH